MTDTVLLTQRLQEAETALHQLLTGGQPVEVKDQNGELVRFNPASAPRLRAYIAELKAILGQGCIGPLQIWI